MLTAFSRRAPEFFLTGGAALAHFYLRHRDTEDLDFFVTSDLLSEGVVALKGAADEIGASVTALTDAPDMKRFLVSRGSEEAVKVDLVRERQPQLAPKAVIDGIAVDQPEEILALKLQPSVLTRFEPRDLVDIWHLEKLGLRFEDGLRGAMKKEAFTAAELANRLRTWHITADGIPPGTLTVQQLQAYLEELIDRLVRAALPHGP